MQNELAKTYDFVSVEDRIYEKWLKQNYFRPEIDETKEPFTIVIPPPNVTGTLHMGHALDNTMQDILIRFHKMQGFNALWVPGTDHASISTELKIIEALAREGLTKEELGREAYLKRAWEWKDEYGGIILKQLKKLGCACDWSRERFTMDNDLSQAVLEVFVRMYEDGLIYRGERMINWCPVCETSISDAEVDYEEKEGSLWHMCYMTESGERLAFATTRPETMLGDTALAVNPKDERYAKFVGSFVRVPVVDRIIPVIADEYVDMEYGTGIVKITPGHDPNDYEVGLRHGLPVINIMDDNGVMNENAGKYNGYTAADTRGLLVREFDDLGLFIKQEKITHSVGVHERCKTVAEPLVRLQWFVKMKPLAKPAIEAYESGALNIVPKRFGKIYLHWLNNIKDWCISRQLWWGHRIPAYYCDKCTEITVSKTQPDMCKCGGALRQDEDVLDTWFSSALWPFSTLGWPSDTPEMRYFYPTNVLVTSYDILFFWVVRMVFSGLYHTGTLPFKDVLFHGLVRDEHGKKMSKSANNGIDPLEVIEKYGADALRLSLIMGTSPDSDSRFKWEKMDASRNFLNKIWNAARFIARFDSATVVKKYNIEDRWIISRLNNLSKEVSQNIAHYELGLAVTKIYQFIWDEFCDWYIEMIKPRLYESVGSPDGKLAEHNSLLESVRNKAAALETLNRVFIGALKLLHPFMPFITEEIYCYLTGEMSIMLTSMPKFTNELNFANEERQIGIIMDAIKSVRNVRAEKNIKPSKKIEAIITVKDAELLGAFEQSAPYIKNLANISTLEITDDYRAEDECISVVLQAAIVYLPLAGLVDAEAERLRLDKKRKEIKKEIDIVKSKLNNPGFMTKAPQELIEKQREKLAKWEQMLDAVSAEN